jgi:predicted mannosyl-3-phosphoglycerate phosphatase (HAD superfamily)
MAADKSAGEDKRTELCRYSDSDVQNIANETGLSREEICLLIKNFGKNRERVIRIAKAISESRKA